MGSGARRVKVERLAADQLAKMLNSVSSRVYNAPRLHQSAVEAGAEKDKWLFRHERLAGVIYIKETITDITLAEDLGRAVGTKAYFAFNAADVYEGGKSIFLADKSLPTALKFQAGIDLESGGEDTEHDQKVLKILEDLPSLDPFLLRDRMRAAGIEVDDRYFEITDREWQRVRDFIQSGFLPIVEFAFPGMDKGVMHGHAVTLMEKLWEASDMDALGPIIKAMGIKQGDAPAVFQAWKGVMYYDYLFARLQDAWRDYAQWLNASAVPSDVVQPIIRKRIDEDADELRRSIKGFWDRVSKILERYHAAYDQLFRARQSSKGFLDFLSKAEAEFFVLGDSISRIDHAVQIWRAYTEGIAVRRLRSESLHDMLTLTHRVLN